MTIFDAVLRWQRFLEVSEGCNARTRRDYRRYVMAYLADIMGDPHWHGCRDALAVTEDDLVTYLADYTVAQGQTRGMMLRALRSFYGWAESRGVVQRSPVARMKPKRNRYSPAPSLSAEEVARLIAAAGTMSDPRVAAAIQLQLSTACRIGSLVAARVEDVRLGEYPSIVFREAKGDRPYEVPLGPSGAAAAARLVELQAWHPPKSRRQPTLVGVGDERYRQWVHEAARRAGLEHVWTHLLRHTTITRLAEQGVDLRTVMEIANWQDPRLLRRYAAASDTNLRAAVSRL